MMAGAYCHCRCMIVRRTLTDGVKVNIMLYYVITCHTVLYVRLLLLAQHTYFQGLFVRLYCQAGLSLGLGYESRHVQDATKGVWIAQPASMGRGVGGAPGLDHAGHRFGNVKVTELPTVLHVGRHIGGGSVRRGGWWGRGERISDGDPFFDLRKVKSYQ